MNTNAIPHYINLTRINRPIGIYLLLWPTLQALWLAADGFPALGTLIIFLLGTALMRSAGCVINDFADRKFDGHVARTAERPLASGLVTEKEAILLFLSLTFLAFLLVLMTNWLTVQMSLIAVLLAAVYPFMKRYTYLPQVVLGAAFGWAIPMAYTATGVQLTAETWLLFSTSLIWAVVYDTQYAMVDREDDLKIGIKSTAILFGDADRLMVALLQLLTLVGWVLLGLQASLGAVWWLAILVVVALYCYQQWLIRHRERDACFQAFLNNNWVGLILFAALVIDSI